MDLFGGAASKEKNLETTDPLAARLRPTDWPHFFGQEHIVKEGGALRRAVEADRVGSMIFYGPPGTGKTALAQLIASKTKAEVEHTNAVTIGIPDIRKILDAARARRRTLGQRTLLILDEIHHFNKTQQDALLPDVERGVVTLIGLTTENPFFYVNAALLSRSTVFEFLPHTEESLLRLMDWALRDPERGLGGKTVKLEAEAQRELLSFANGDGRRLLNILELAVLSTPPDAKGVLKIAVAAVEQSTQKRAVRYDKKGDEHYDVISAYIKSLRGSDPDAAMYWLAKMLDAGEDPRFIARRLLVAASEDVGNADPRALMIANAVFDAVTKLGMPEARIPLAQGTAYVAQAPKSNAAYLAIGEALHEVRNGPRREVPVHLKDASRDSEALGHGKGYQYSHDFPGHFVKQVYLPELKMFYDPTDIGDEKKIRERLKALWPERYS